MDSYAETLVSTDTALLFASPSEGVYVLTPTSGATPEDWEQVMKHLPQQATVRHESAVYIGEWELSFVSTD